MSALLWIVVLGGLLALYGKLWQRQTAGRVRVTVQAEEAVLIEGEEAELVLTVENHAWLPIPWVDLSQQMPKGLLVWDGTKWLEELRVLSFLLPRQRLQRHYRVRVIRGLHKFEAAAVQFGDGLGMQEIHSRLDAEQMDNVAAKFPLSLDRGMEKDKIGQVLVGLLRSQNAPEPGPIYRPSYTQLLVRPRPLDDWELPLRLTELVGEQAVLRWYQEDTSRLQGVRSYQLGDPYKQIHWAATARTGELMVKQFETTSETEFYVLLNSQLFDPYWMGTNRGIIDHSCRLAMTLLQQVEATGTRIGLATNNSWSGAGSLHVPIGRGPGQLDACSAALGGLLYRAYEPFAAMLRTFRGQLTNRAMLVIVTAYWDHSIAAEVEQLRVLGHNITVLVYPRAAHRLQGLHAAIPVIAIDLPLSDAADAGDEVEAVASAASAETEVSA